MKDSTPSTRATAPESPLHDVPTATQRAGTRPGPQQALVEDLLVGAFLAQMGPGAAPAGLVERSVQLVRRETRSEQRAASTWSRARQLAVGFGWAVRGPALALNGDWASHGASQTLQGLSMARYAFGTAFVSGARSPKRRRRGWVGRLLFSAGGSP